MNLRTKLKGGALYIALIVSIVIGIVLSVFILIAYFNQRQVLGRLALTQLQFNLKSGLSFASSQAFSMAYNNTWQALPFNEDSIRVKKLQWGCYEIISVESKNRNHYVKEAALYGLNASVDTAIIVADRSRPIGLSGKIRFNGGCYFPKAGIKPAYIEGESFTSDGSLNGFLRQAPMQVPPVKEKLIEQLKTCVHDLNPATDSLVVVWPESLQVAFSAKTAVLQGGQVHLNVHQFSGNVKLVADEVTLEESCQLNNILIVASKVRLKKGFKGSVHILAKDSVIAEEGCTLNYPSSLTVLSESGGGTGMRGVFLGPGCIVHGALVALTDSSDYPLMVKLNKECEIYGLVYSGNYAHVQGKVFGTVFCQTLLLTTPSAVYENHMLGCELDPKKYGHSLVVPSLFSTNYAYKPGKWL